MIIVNALGIKDAKAAGKLAVTAPYEDASTHALLISIAEPVDFGVNQGVISGNVVISDPITNVNKKFSQKASVVCWLMVVAILSLPKMRR